MYCAWRPLYHSLLEQGTKMKFTDLKQRNEVFNAEVPSGESFKLTINKSSSRLNTLMSVYEARTQLWL